MRRAAIALALLALTGAPAMAGETPAERTEAFAQLPYWPGYWVNEYQAGTTIGGYSPLAEEARDKGESLPPGYSPLGGAKAPWNEEGKKRYAANRAAAKGRKALGWGYPRMMDSATPIQFLITPEEVLIVNAYNEVRHVYTDGRPMPPKEDLWPTVEGTSIGHWEGDTLVIETIMVKTPSEFFHGAPPLSEQARYVERIRLDGERLVADVTITDPVTLAEPWNVSLSWIRDQGFDRMIQVDWDNDRTGVDENGVNTIEAAPTE
jgi:hypothetical protein